MSTSLELPHNRQRSAHAVTRALRRRSNGKILVLIAIMLPTLCGLIGLMIDGGLLFAASRRLQDVCDSAVTAAAMEKMQGATNSEAQAVAERFFVENDQASGATITFHSPPTSGPYAGSDRYVELIVEVPVETHIIQVLGNEGGWSVAARSVAGFEPSTTGAAIVVLESVPGDLSMSSLPALPVSLTPPTVTGGLEVEGLGVARVDAAVLVNTAWGGLDENGDQVGEDAGIAGLAHAVSATPLLPLTRLRARDLRVVGGVDSPSNYSNYDSSLDSPLQAGRLPVPDPFQDLDVPTTSSDPNVVLTSYGGRTVVGLPLIGPPVTLRPGIYDWIDVTSGIANFQPGIYIIRGRNPITQISLNILAGQVTANGVMFYITDSADYSPITGQPDEEDANSPAPVNSVMTMTPSVVINIGLLGSSLSGLNDGGSPFDDMLIYQRRNDRRPIVLVQENLLGAGQMQGTIYAKSSHVLLAGKGTYDARFVVGTMRIVALLDLTIRPSVPLPAAQDVYLVE